MLKVSATEVKESFGKYLAMAENQEILITKNGKPVAKLTNVSDSNLDMDQVKRERLAKNENID